MLFERAVPVLRIFDQAKAEEFYLDYLGFTTDWEHRFAPDFPSITVMAHRAVSCSSRCVISEHSTPKSLLAITDSRSPGWRMSLGG